MNKLVNDQLIEEIEIKPVDMKLYHDPIKVHSSPELAIIAGSLNFFGLNKIDVVSSAVLDREGIGINEIGFRYPTDELDPGEEPLQGVEIYNFSFGEIQLSIYAFEKLMARYFRAVIEETERQVAIQKPEDDPTKKSWWSEFVGATEQIEQRLQI